MAEQGKVNLDDLAASVLELFPALNALERRLSLELYRLLSEGDPVPRPTLAERVGITVESANHILDRWPGVISDSRRQVVGYWGLSLAPTFASPHQLMIDGQILSAWCAWDTLFLPQLLGRSTTVESRSPISGATICLTVTPDDVSCVNPPGAQMSFRLPCGASLQRIVTTFCCFVHFFASFQAADRWAEQHSGTFILSIEEAYDLGRRKNEAQYSEALKLK